MMKRISRLVLVGLLLLLGATQVFAAKNVVLPTAYGYGVVRPDGGFVYPYISGWGFPYLSPYLPFPSGYYPFFMEGYYPYYGDLSGSSGNFTPIWNGLQWVYPLSGLYGTVVSSARLHLRSSPGMGGSKGRNANVIGSLAKGEAAFIQGRVGNWVLVQSASAPFRRGFAYYSYLRSVGGAWPYCQYPGYLGYGAYVRR